MNRTTVVAAGLTLAAVLFAAPALAQNARTFGSGHGSDANDCKLATPCRTFAAAYALTNAGGEIDVLDPAGYGPLTITRAVSIINDGVGTSALIAPVGGAGITINAGVNDAVSLRGLTIDGQGNGSTGINSTPAHRVPAMRACAIRLATPLGRQLKIDAKGQMRPGHVDQQTGETLQWAIKVSSAMEGTRSEPAMLTPAINCIPCNARRCMRVPRLAPALSRSLTSGQLWQPRTLLL
jgi:hypothetical protein